MNSKVKCGECGNPMKWRLANDIGSSRMIPYCNHENDEFYKKNAKEYSQAIGRILSNSFISKHEKRVYIYSLNKRIEKLENIVD